MPENSPAENQEIYLCLSCNASANSLYKRTEGKFIKLFECEKCGDIVDHYVECERSIIVTDLIMQESAAYKHILYNSSEFSPQFYLKLVMGIILSEGYVRWSIHHEKACEGITIRNNEYFYYITCLTVFFELLTFSLVSYLLFPEKNCKTPGMLAKAIVLGQSGRLFNIAAIIYKQGGSPFVQAFIVIFVFISTVQSIRAITFKDRIITSVDVAAATVISFIASRLFQGLIS